MSVLQYKKEGPPNTTVLEMVDEDGKITKILETTLYEDRWSPFDEEFNENSHTIKRRVQ